MEIEKTKNYVQTNDCLCFSHAGSPLKAYLRLRRWTDLNASDIKIFVAHLIVMGLVKITMAKYWSTNSLTMTPILWQNIVKKYLPEYPSEPAHI